MPVWASSMKVLDLILQFTLFQPKWCHFWTVADGFTSHFNGMPKLWKSRWHKFERCWLTKLRSSTDDVDNPPAQGKIALLGASIRKLHWETGIGGRHFKFAGAKGGSVVFLLRFLDETDLKACVLNGSETVSKLFMQNCQSKVHCRRQHVWEEKCPVAPCRVCMHT